MNKIKRLILIAAVLYIGLCVAVYFGQEFLLFHPKKLAENHVLRIDQAFRELEIRVEKDVSLNAALFECEDSKGLVLFFHGNGGSVEHCSPVMKRFTDEGWDGLLMDYRSYGKSDGELGGETFLSDALACFDYAKDSLGYEHIIIYGESIGSGLATYLAAMRTPNKIILEAPYFSIERIAKAKFPFLPIVQLLEYPLPSHEYIERSNCPILAFHGTEDRTIPIEEHAMALKAQFPKIKLVILEGGGHIGFDGFPAYRKALTDFLSN